MGPSHAAGGWVCQRLVFTCVSEGQRGCSPCTPKTGVAEFGNESSLVLIWADRFVLWTWGTGGYSTHRIHINTGIDYVGPLLIFDVCSMSYMRGRLVWSSQLLVIFSLISRVQHQCTSLGASRVTLCKFSVCICASKWDLADAQSIDHFCLFSHRCFAPVSLLLLHCIHLALLENISVAVNKMQPWNACLDESPFRERQQLSSITWVNKLPPTPEVTFPSQMHTICSIRSFHKESESSAKYGVPLPVNEGRECLVHSAVARQTAATKIH